MIGHATRRITAALRVLAFGAVGLLAAPCAGAGDVVFLVDTTGSMFGQSFGPNQTRVEAVRSAVVNWTAAAVADDAQARFALVLVHGDGSCTLATPLSSRDSFLAGAVANFEASIGGSVGFSGAIVDCAQLAAVSPRLPHDVVIVTDTLDETSTVPQRDAAVAALIGTLRAMPSVVMLVPNSPTTGPALSDLVTRGGCIEASLRWFNVATQAELVDAGNAAIGGYTESTWPCNALFGNGFEASVPN